MEKSYNFKEVEARLYGEWEKSGRFSQDTSSENTFLVFMPPPNVTGILHMGHTLNNTLQDVFARWARLIGKEVLWVPGTDHAGIATQNKVEKVIAKEGLSKESLGREKFLEKVVEWRDKHGGIIFNQLKKIGISCDWSRSVHTLDEGYSKGVLTGFVKLYERGYVYRGKRLVNWCPVSLTALSDEEVNMKTEAGKLYTFLYKITGEDKHIRIATTRPETIMGDVAVAVNPNDMRYKDFVGKHCECIFSDKTIPIIADEAVEVEFGTGALKITPAHDSVDFDVGARHGLPLIDVLNANGTINEFGAPFQGLDRFEARNAVVASLKEKGLLEKIEDYEHTVGYSERADVPIEPRLSEQWFVKYPKVEEAKQIVERGLISFWPKRWVKTYIHWLENIHDWCISRQLWWGHRIPVWYHKEDSTKMHVSIEPPKDVENWVQDADVLDTWFSSWIWPFGVFDWPNKAAMAQKDFEKFFPSEVLVSGPDILFFWITRMIIASLEFLDDRPIEKRIPFKNIYLTGIVRDSIGRKMSKSLGNSPDPLDLIENYGADGLRIGLLTIAPSGQDIRFDESFLVQGRNFCTKLWNACRFRTMQGELFNYNNSTEVFQQIKKYNINIYDKHMLSKLVTAITLFADFFEKFEINQAVKFIQQFFKNEFCDWYLEVSKYAKKDNGSLHVQDACLRQILLLLSPFAPFITDELWQILKFGNGFLHDELLEKSSVISQINEIISENSEEIEIVSDLTAIVSELRSTKATFGLSAQKKDVKFLANIHTSYTTAFQQHKEILEKLVGIENVELSKSIHENLPATVTKWGTFFLVTKKNSDDKQKILDEIKELEKHISAAKSKLSNTTFLNNAPANVINGVKTLLAKNEQLISELKSLM